MQAQNGVEFYIHDESDQLQPTLSEVNQIVIQSQDMCSGSDTNPFPHVCWALLEVLRCDWLDLHAADALENEIYNLLGQLESTCRSNKLPALRIIIISDQGQSPSSIVSLRSPADLAGIQELVIATDRRLRLVFDSPCSAGERLTSLYAVACEVRVDAAAMPDMTNARLSRGLTLSRAQAGQEHENAPSQCLYVHAVPAPDISYDEVIPIMNARVGLWVESDDDACGQCGACYVCFTMAEGYESA